MEAIANGSWTLWYAAIAAATIGQVVSISGDGIIRMVTGTAIAVIGIGTAVYAATTIDPHGTLTPSAVLAGGAATVTVAALRAEWRRLGATCFAATSMTLLIAFATAAFKTAQKWF